MPGIARHGEVGRGAVWYGKGLMAKFSVSSAEKNAKVPMKRAGVIDWLVYRRPFSFNAQLMILPVSY